jgi:hypothetical protein
MNYTGKCHKDKNMSIDDIFEKNKAKLRMLGVFVLIFSFGFGCGYYYLDAEREEAAVVATDNSAGCAALFEAAGEGDAASAPTVAESQASENAAGQVLSGSTQAGKLFAASKNSTLYHTPDCQYVKRIKEENRVWFGSAEEAQAAGKSPHSCISG